MPSKLSESEATAIMLAAGLQPQVHYPGASKPWPCRCLTCGEQGAPRLANVRLRGRGCRACGIRTRADGRRHDENSAKAHFISAGLVPQGPYPGANVPWPSVCSTCGAHVSPRLSTVQRGHGCFRCGRLTTGLAKRSDAHAMAAELIQAGAAPQVPYPGIDKPWPSICCSCGRDIAPRLLAIRNGQGPCKYCASLTSGLKRRNDAEEMKAMMVEAGLIPLVDYPGINLPWLCECVTCSATVAPRAGHVRSGGKCGSCSSRGMDPTAPAIVYVIMHLGHQAGKIGITSLISRTDRIKDHARMGWSLVGYRACSNGALARRIEQDALSRILVETTSGMRCPPTLRSWQMPHGGYTETFSLDRMSGINALHLIEVIADSMTATPY